MPTLVHGKAASDREHLEATDPLRFEPKKPRPPSCCGRILGHMGLGARQHEAAHEPEASPLTPGVRWMPGDVPLPSSWFERLLGLVGRGPRHTWVERRLEERVGFGVTRAIVRIRLGMDFCRACMDLNFRWRRVPFNFRLIAKACEKETRYAHPLFGTGKPCRRGENFRLAARYVSFASASYQPPTEEEIAEHIQDLGPEDILHIHQDRGVMCPNFFIADDPVTEAIVVCIRGTARVADALTNVLSKPTPFLDGMAHSGILKMARLVANEAGPVILQILKDSPGRKVAFAGHSLGGATAILATLALFGPGTEHHEHMVEGRVKCFAFGPPPVLSMSAALPACVTDNVHTFVHNFDAVPRANPVALCKLFMAIEEVDRLPVSWVERLSGKAPKQELPDFVEMTQQQEDELELYLGKYYHTGQLVLVYRDEKGQPACEELDGAVAERCLVHPEMFTDHWMGNYEYIVTHLAPFRPSFRRSNCKSEFEMTFVCDSVAFLSRQQSILRAASSTLCL